MNYSFDLNSLFLSQFKPNGLRHIVDRKCIVITRGANAQQGIELISYSAKGTHKLLNGIVVYAEEWDSQHTGQQISELARFLRVLYNLVLDEQANQKLDLAGRGFELGRINDGSYKKWVIPAMVYTTTNTYVAIEYTERYKIDRILKNQDLYFQWDDSELVQGDVIKLWVTLDYYVGTLKEESGLVE